MRRNVFFLNIFAALATVIMSVYAAKPPSFNFGTEILIWVMFSPVFGVVFASPFGGLIWASRFKGSSSIQLGVILIATFALILLSMNIFHFALFGPKSDPHGAMMTLLFLPIFQWAGVGAVLGINLMIGTLLPRKP